MKNSRIPLVIIAAILSLTGCASSAQTSSPPATKNPIVEKEPVADPIAATPSGELPKNLTTSREANLRVVEGTTANYWSDDWCHYFVGNDGITYGDTCLRSKPNGAGGAVPNQYLLYRYDPNAVGSLGPALMEFYTGYAGYTTYRDLTNPQFNQVAWVSFPTAMQITADNMLVGVYNANSQLVWYRVSDLQGQPLNGSNTGTAQNYPARVPSWDPSITVWSNPMLSNVYNIPTGMY